MVKVANPLYTDWILEAIQKVKRQKQRPSEERICNAVASAHGLDRQTVLEQLELSVRDGSVLLVCSKGLSSYRDPAAAAAPSWSGLDWQALIRRALEVLQEAGGSPLKSLEHWVQQQPEVVALLGPAGAQGPSRLHQQLRLALKRAVTQGRVVKQGRLYQVGGAAGPLASLPPVRLLPHEKDKPVAEPIPICSFCLGTEEQNRERKPEELISCADCGNSGHPSCLKFSPELTLRVKALWWQCIECKTCSFCQDQGKNADNMLFCDSCDRGFHMECCDPPLTRMPKGMWICQVCQPRNQEGRKLLHDTAAQIKRRYGGPLGRPKGRSHQSFRKLHGPGRPGRPRGPGRPSWRSSSGRGRGRPPRVTRSPFPFTEGYPGDDLQLFAPKDEDYSNNGKPANLSLYMSSSPELCEEEEEDDACLGLTKVEGHKQQELGEGSAGSPHGSVEQQESEVLRLEECDLELFRHVQEMALRKVGVASGRISSRPRRPPVVEFGNFEIQAWYSSPYPQGYSRLPKLYLCEFCLHYMRSRSILFQHRRRCHWYHPPADEIYRKDNLSVFEVDGSVSTSYCQNLCLLAKFFLDHKTLYQDVEPFLFYVLTQNDGKGCHLVGYFSKEKHCLQRCNVSCIMILPQYQRKGYGRFLIDFSYLLSKREGRPGSPEKPLSDLGRLSYTAYWRSTLMEYLHTVGRRKQLCICQLSQATGICPQDVSSTLRDIGMLRRCGDSLLLVRRESLISAHMARLRARPRLLEVDPHCLRWSPGPCSNGVVSDGEEEDEEERKGEKLFERVPGETRKHLPESPPHRSQSSPLPSPPSPAHSPGLPSLPRSTSVKNQVWGKVKDRPRGQRGRPRKNPRPEDKEPVAGEEDELPVQEASVEKMPRLQPTPAPRSRGRPPHRKRGPKPKPVELSPADTPVPSDVPPPGEQEEEEEEEEDDEEEEEMEEEPNSPSPSVPTLKSKKPLRRRRGRQRSFPPSSVVTETISETTQVLDGPLADSDPENSTPACAAPVPPTPGRQPALTDSEEEEEDEVVEDDEGEEGSMQGLTTVPVEPPATPHAKRRGWSKGECFMPASPPIPEGAETQPQRRGVEVEEEEEQEEEDVQQLTTHNAEELDKEEPEQDAGQTLPPSPASAFDGEEASTGSGGGLATQEKWEVPDNHVGMASEEKWEGPENQVRVANPEKWEGTVSGGPTHILDGPMNEDGPVNEKAGQWEWKDKEEVGPLQEEGLADDQAERQRREREAAAVEALSILPASPEQPPPPPAGTKPDLELETVQVGQSLSEARDAAAAYQDCEETVAACRALQSFSQAEEEEEEEQRGGPAVALVEEEEDQEQEEEESGPAPGPAPTPTAYPEASPATGVVDSGFSDLGSIESTSESYDTHSGYEAGLLPTPLLDRAPPTSVAPAFTTPASSCSSSSFPTSSAPPPPLQPSRPPQKKKQQQPAPRPPSQCSMASCYASTPMVMEVPESGLYEGSYPQPSATFSLAKLQQLTNTIMDPHMLYTCAPAAQAPPTVPPGPLLACTVPSGPTSRRSQGQTALSKGPVAIRSKPPPPQQPPQLFSSARTLVPNLVPAPVTYYSGPRPVANGSYHGNPSYVSPPAQYPVQVGVMGGQAYPQQPGSHGNVMYTGPSHHGYINAGVPKQSPYMSR